MFYANNDDNLMNAILNGSYLGHTDSHAFFVNAPVSNVLQLLYSIVGWDTLVSLNAVFSSLSAARDFLIQRKRKAGSSGTVCFISAGILAGFVWFHLYYCLCNAGHCGAGGLLTEKR